MNESILKENLEIMVNEEYRFLENMVKFYSGWTKEKIRKNLQDSLKIILNHANTIDKDCLYIRSIYMKLDSQSIIEAKSFIPNNKVSVGYIIKDLSKDNLRIQFSCLPESEFNLKKLEEEKYHLVYNKGD